MRSSDPYPGAPPAISARVLTLAWSPSLDAIDEAPLRGFVDAHEVVEIRSEFLTVNQVPRVVCLVVYRPSAPPASTRLPPEPEPTDALPAPPPRRPRNDRGAPTIAPHDRPLYADLRAWRSARSSQDGVPPYVLLTNAQLAAIAETRPDTLAALQRIDGIGPKKTTSFGAELLGIVHPELRETPGAEPATTEAEA